MLLRTISPMFIILTLPRNASKISIQLQMSGVGGQWLPRCLEELVAKDVFQICLTPYNFTPPPTSNFFSTHAKVEQYKLCNTFPSS